ncbi:MAG TPA: hypothetical protein VFS37_10365, partial [Conexibacter sp.]|nr:hypothetical protein [Conexibacter sp.]
LVAAVLALAAGLTSGGLGGHVLAGLQRGLCRVADVRCPHPERPRDELDPCLVERTASSELLAGGFETLELGGGGTLSTERMSDGRVQVTLADDRTLGGAIGLGFSVALGRRHDATVTADVHTSFAAGRSWTLPNAVAARAFIARHGTKATVGGKAVDVVRSGCSILCDAIGWRPHAVLPPADAITFDRGSVARLGAALGPIGLEAAQGRAMGVELLRDGGSAWSVALDAAVGAALLPAARLGIGAGHELVLTYTLDARQRPVSLAVKTVKDGGAFGAVHPARGGAVAGASGAVAHLAELEGTLDLRDARNLAAAVAFKAALRDPFAVARLQRSAAALGRRVASAGVVSRRTYAVSSSAFAIGGRVMLGGALGGGFERTREGMRLVSAETRLPGLPFLPRDDCRPA